MVILHTIEKLAISLLICLFSCGFLHCNILWWLRFQSILIRVMCDLYFLFFSLPKFGQKIGHFWKFSFGSPFAVLPKMAILHTIVKIAVSLLICLFSCGFLHCNNLWWLRFQCILIRVMCDLYSLFFSVPNFYPKNRPFLKIFLWSPLCCFAKNGHFIHYWKSCYLSSNMSFFVRFFAL